MGFCWGKTHNKGAEGADQQRLKSAFRVDTMQL